ARPPQRPWRSRDGGLPVFSRAVIASVKRSNLETAKCHQMAGPSVPRLAAKARCSAVRRRLAPPRNDEGEDALASFLAGEELDVNPWSRPLCEETGKVGPLLAVDAVLPRR